MAVHEKSDHFLFIYLPPSPFSHMTFLQFFYLIISPMGPVIDWRPVQTVPNLSNLIRKQTHPIDFQCEY